jgi:glycosyltransferase involved in cell wall biosynthesis
MKQKSILHVITHLELGGAQKATLSLLSYLGSKKYKLFLATSCKGELGEEAKRIPYLEIKCLPRLKSQPSIFFDLICLFSLYRFIRRQNIKLVHTHCPKAGIIGRWAAKLAGVPLIVHTYHGLGFEAAGNPISRWFYIWLERLTAKITNFLILVCDENIKKAKRYKIGNTKQFILIKEGIDKNKLDNPTVSREELLTSIGFSKKYYIITLIAALKPQKRPLDFIKAAEFITSKYSNARFLIVGDGKLKRKINRAIIKNRLERFVKLVGWQKDIENWLNATDLVVSTSEWEGMPLAVLEAMYLGKAVVATSVDGISEVLKDNVNGLLYDCGDIDSLRDKISYIIEDQNAGRRLGGNAKSSMKDRFELSSFHKTTDELYQKLLF